MNIKKPYSVFDENGSALYNVYDADDHIVYIGTQKDIMSYLDVGRAKLTLAIEKCKEIKGYLIADRGLMMEYERRRKNKRGYQRCGNLL